LWLQEVFSQGLASYESNTSAAAAAATAATTGEATSVGGLATEEKTATSTIDSLGVNLDENSSTASNEESTTSELDSVGEIEGRSISRSDSDGNSVPSSSSSNARLSIDKTSSSDRGEDLESSGSEDAAASAKPARTASKQAKPINMTQVDQLYTSGHKNEHETILAWQRMGKMLKKGITNAIGSIVPMALNMSQEAHISSNCSGAVLKWILSMNQLKSWALHMLDATGKPIAGLLEVSLLVLSRAQHR